MLKEIKLNNYKTFINDTLIDVSATNYKFLEKENVSKNRILKGLLFVGENASGKTNVIQSIKFLLDLLFGNNEIELYLSQSFYTDKKTYQLGYTFLINGKEIYYEIEFKNEKEAKNTKLPNWFGKDISNIVTNSQMAMKNIRDNISWV